MSEVKVNKITPTADCGTVTLGDSGDAITIPSGVTLTSGGAITNSGTITNTGTISGGTITGNVDGLVTWDTTAKTASFTAVAGNGYFVNTTSGAITVTLPASPSAGDLVAVKDYAFTADTNNITLARNGSNIQGTASDFVIDTEGRSVSLIYVDATQGWLLTGSSQKSDVTGPLFLEATGGTVTTCGDFKIHTFTGPGTFQVTQLGNSDSVPAGGPSNVDYLVIAGGAGGGARFGGGGGAGGYRESSGTESGCYSVSPRGACVSALPMSVQSYPITVGSGGNGGPISGGPGTNGANAGSPGSNSVFSTITSNGGGGGGRGDTGNGSSGGSGGGAAGRFSGSGGSGNSPPTSPAQGTNGGGAPGGSPNYNGGGGGGAINSGGTGGPSGSGDGGNGGSNSINGTATTRAGGGGAGGDAPGTPGSGGSGGGGAGGNPGANATTNTGSGGGGGDYIAPHSQKGGNGASGIVIIRYKFQ